MSAFDPKRTFLETPRLINSFASTFLCVSSWAKRQLVQGFDDPTLDIALIQSQNVRGLPRRNAFDRDQHE